MADINQWRKKIQPARSRTPVFSGERDDMDPENAHSHVPYRKKSRPKLSAYLSHYIPSTSQSKPPPFLDNHTGLVDSPSFSTDLWKQDSETDTDQVMDSIMRMLMAQPYSPLDISHNTSILMIFETYRALRDRNAALVETLEHEMDARYSAQLQVEDASKKWQREKEEYKAEVKMLELIIAKGKAGLAGVAQVRQDSVLRRSQKQSDDTVREDHKETVFEFLERTRTEDEEAKGALRALFRHRPISPSHRMAALSHKISTISLHDNILLKASSGSFREPTNLSEASYFGTRSSQPDLFDLPERDTKQHHLTDIGLADGPSSSIDGFAIQHGNQDSAALANTPPNMKGKQSTILSAGDRMDLPSFKVSKGSSNGLSASRGSRRRPDSLRLDHDRRFSFELGDDITPSHHTFQPAQSPLQRSVSVSYFNQGPRYSSSSQRGSGNQITSNPLSTPSLASTPTLESPRLSKIPSPVFDASLARPRREDSASSFLTAIRAPHAGGELSRTTSRSSNPDCSRQSSRDSVEDGGTLAANQRPSEGETGLRGNNIVISAARVTGPPNAQRLMANLPPQPQLCTSHVREKSTIKAGSPPQPFDADRRSGGY